MSRLKRCLFGNMTLKNTNWLEHLVETARKLSGRLQDRLLAIYKKHVPRKAQSVMNCCNHSLHREFVPLSSITLVFLSPVRATSAHTDTTLCRWLAPRSACSVKHSWTSENICMLGPILLLALCGADGLSAVHLLRWLIDELSGIAVATITFPH